MGVLCTDGEQTMHRRGFLQTGALGVAAGALASPAAASATTVDVAAVRSEAPAVLKSYTAEDHRRRLQNIGVGTQSIRKCMRKHLITNYLPAQCAYNLGEYPCVKPWDPDAYDEQELDRLRDQGIQLIQLFDESNDSLRLCGGSKHTPLNPEGLRRFVALAHRRGIKVITYLSTGYFQYQDPDLKPEWYRKGDGVTVGYWDMVRCSPASPGWRAYLLPHAVRLLDDYGLDGLYDDWGYLPNTASRPKTPARDEVPAFEETPTYDGAVADLLELLYAEVHRRGGVFKLHCDAANAPQTRGARVYDYLWVGENDFWVKRCRAVEAFLKTHPHGPYTYGGWDSVPGRAQTRPTHARWLKRYMPLVEDGTWAWLEIKDSTLFTAPLPKGVVASAFANRELHLVLANYGRAAAEVETTAAYVPTDQPSPAPTRRWSVGPRSLLILRRTAES